MPKNPMACAIYSQPTNSVYYTDDTWVDLESDILDLTTKETPYCIIGDMNGRTGVRSDFAIVDKFNIAPPRTCLETPRRNCDKQLNKIGEKLLQICKSYDMQIANGRTRGDFIGNFTHHNKHKGQSAVDLALISDTLFPHIDDFKVLPQTDVSDHSKIVLTISNIKPIINLDSNNNYQWHERKREYKWEDDSPQKFLTAINSAEVKTIINDCKQHIEAGLIESSGILLQEIFQKTADLSLDFKAKKKAPPTNQKKHRKSKSPKKWFDTDCIQLKAKTKRAANLKHKNPSNKNLEDHRKILKEYIFFVELKNINFGKRNMKILNAWTTLIFGKSGKNLVRIEPMKLPTY